MGSTNTSRPPTVLVADEDVAIVEYRGERVVTFAMVDGVHQRPDGTASRNFRENRDRFVDGEDFMELTADEIRRQSLQLVFPSRTPKGIILTRRGYLKLTKPMNDDRAWAVQGEMIDRYFVAEAAAAALGELSAEARSQPLRCFALDGKPHPLFAVQCVHQVDHGCRFLQIHSIHHHVADNSRPVRENVGDCPGHAIGTLGQPVSLVGHINLHFAEGLTGIEPADRSTSMSGYRPDFLRQP